MKKIYAIFGLALAMLTAGCAKDATNDVMPGKVTIGVGIEQTRTSLGTLNGQEYSVLWSAGDKIAVNGVASEALEAAAAGTSKATFTVANVAAPYSILYPAEILGLDGNITVATEQAYTPGSFASGSAVLVGYSENTTASLKNLYSFVKVTINKGGDEVLKSVTLTALNGEAISGTFAVDYQDATISALSGKDLIRVSAAEGIPYVDGKAEVIIAVPAGNYAGGFGVKIVDAAGKAMEKKAYTTAGIEVPAGVLLNMPAITYAGVEQSVVTVTNAAELQAALAQFQLDVIPEVLPHIVLGNDIDLAGVALTIAADFYGVFDGQGYAIKNWAATRGLFAKNHGTVKNVVIDESCTLTYTAPEGASGDQNVAFIVEDNEEPGWVIGCVNKGKLVLNDVSCGAHRTGTIVGVSYGSVADCVNYGNVEVNSSVVNNGQFIGGVVGYANPNAGTKEALGTDILTNCINYGDVSVLFPCKPGKAYVGGVLGGTQAAASTSAAYLGQIKNCLNYGDVSYRFETLDSGTYANVGGVIGYAQNSIENCDNYGNVSYTTPTDPAFAGTRAAAGGVVGCTLFGIKDCNNYGDLFAEGVWAAGTNDAAGAGSQGGTSMGGVVGCTGIYNKYSADYPVENCSNYGEVNLDVACKTAGGTAGYIAGVVGFTSNDVKNCHNYGKTDIASFIANTYLAGVLGYAQFGNADNLSNNGEVTLTAKGVTSTGRTLYLAGVVGRAVNITNCVNNGATNQIVNPCDIVISTIYSGAVAGYADTKIENCTLNAAYSLTTADNQASLRCAGVVGQVKTGTAPFNSVVNCNTTNKASVTLVTKNTKANYIGGIIASCNNGIDGCTNEAPITVTTLEPNNGSSIYHIGGIAGNQKEVLSNSHNKADINVDFGNSTCPLNAATLVGTHNNATSVVKDCTNSGNLTIINCASATLNVGEFGGSNPVADDGTTVTFENCTNTGVITVNGQELGAAPALSLDGKQWLLPAEFAMSVAGFSTDVIADLGVSAPGYLVFGASLEPIYGAQAAGQWQALMDPLPYTVTATDATSGIITISQTDHFGDVAKFDLSYSNLTENSVTIDLTNMGMGAGWTCTLYTGNAQIGGGGTAM